MSTLTSIIAANFLVSLVALVGAVLLIFFKQKIQSLLPSFVGFAAGVLLTSSFIDIIPEALEAGNYEEYVYLSIFGGIVLFFLLERFMIWSHHHHDHKNIHSTTPLILIGDSIHNAIDGVAIAASFLANPILGWQTTLAVMAHEAPHEISDLALLIGNKLPPKKALGFNFISGLTAIIGGIAGYYFLDISEAFIPILLGFAGGMFIYIACTDLIPEMHEDFAKNKRWSQTIPFVLGIAIAFISRMLLE